MTSYLIPVTYYRLPITHDLYPITYHPLPTTYYLLPITYYLLSTDNHTTKNIDPTFGILYNTGYTMGPVPEL